MNLYRGHYKDDLRARSGRETQMQRERGVEKRGRGNSPRHGYVQVPQALVSEGKKPKTMSHKLREADPVITTRRW